MSTEQWHGATDVLGQLRVASQLWLCPCHHFGSPDRENRCDGDCPFSRGSPMRRYLTRRKQRLLACGACRFLGDELTGEPALRAVEAAERYADDLIPAKALASAREKATAPAARAAAMPSSWHAALRATEQALARLAELHESRLAVDLHVELNQVLANAEANYGHLGRAAVKGYRKRGEQRFRAHFAEILGRARAEDARALAEVPRDILGDPFDAPRLDSNWLLAHDSRVRQVAQAIYDEGRFDEMPILADALQDAGCNNAQLLDHCLQDRHYRGCWLLDGILGHV